MLRKITLLVLTILLLSSLLILKDYQKYQENKEETIIQNNALKEENIEQENSEVETFVFLKNASESDIEYDSYKPNVYLFYGNTCPYCERELTFLEEIYPEYQNYFNFYAFEVWDNDSNGDLFMKVAEKLDKKATSIPFLIVGDEVIIGFSEDKKETILEAIKENKKLKVDNYKKYFS